MITYLYKVCMNDACNLLCNIDLFVLLKWLECFHFFIHAVVEVLNLFVVISNCQ